jgi:hypothetical protein
MAIGRCLLSALRHAVVATDGSDAQTIVAEDAFATGGLRCSVTSTSAPASCRPSNTWHSMRSKAYRGGQAQSPWPPRCPATAARVSKKFQRSARPHCREKCPPTGHIFALGCLSRWPRRARKPRNIGLIRSLAVIHRMTLLNSGTGKGPQINDKTASGAGHANH